MKRQQSSPSLSVVGPSVVSREGGIDTIRKTTQEEYRGLSFFQKVHLVLVETEAVGVGDMCSFLFDGQSFRLHKPNRFTEEGFRRYFQEARTLLSLYQHFDVYGFTRMTVPATTERDPVRDCPLESVVDVAHFYSARYGARYSARAKCAIQSWINQKIPSDEREPQIE